MAHFQQLFNGQTKFSSRKPSHEDVMIHQATHPIYNGIESPHSTAYERRFIRQEPLLDCWVQIFRKYDQYVLCSLIGTIPLTFQQWLHLNYNVPHVRIPK